MPPKRKKYTFYNLVNLYICKPFTQHTQYSISYNKICFLWLFYESSSCLPVPFSITFDLTKFCKYCFIPISDRDIHTSIIYECTVQQNVTKNAMFSIKYFNIKYETEQNISHFPCSTTRLMLSSRRRIREQRTKGFLDL